MREFFTHWSPGEKSASIVTIANEIIYEYDQAGYTLTLRQLYYQFVARDLIENSERSYKNLGNVITKARMAGMICWDAIEDRNRTHNSHWSQESTTDLIGRLPRAIRFDRWARQPVYVEVWVEKEALGNVIRRACDPLLVPHLACKGYLSVSEAYRAGKRFEARAADGQECVLLHFGDHDPSGIDMTRDNKDRVDLFSNFSGPVDVRRMALNMGQVEQYSPPPNPAKVTDSRAKDYISKFGRTSWELDALEPSVIEELIKTEVESLIDWDAWQDTIELENEKINILEKLERNWGSIKDDLQDL